MFYRVVGREQRMAQFADYLPTDPNVLGTMTYEITALPNDVSFVTNRIHDCVRVPYRSGAIIGVRIASLTAGPGEGLYGYNDGESIYVLGTSGRHFSTDTLLTVHPPGWRWSTVYDGQMLNQDYVVYDFVDPAQSASASQKKLFRIQDVDLPLGTYTNAIVEWTLDLGEAYRPLEFHGWETQMGLVPPASEETAGYAVTGFSVFGFRTGEVAAGDFASEAGELTEVRRLIAVAKD
jgi:hypothetical protein